MSDIDAGIARIIAPLTGEDDTILMEPAVAPLAFPKSETPLVAQFWRVTKEGKPGETLYGTCDRLMNERDEWLAVARRLWRYSRKVTPEQKAILEEPGETP